MRDVVIKHMHELLGDDAVLMVPSAPGPAPILNLPQNELNTYRKQLISLTSIAGLAKLPQVWCLPCFRLLNSMFTTRLGWQGQVSVGLPSSSPQCCWLYSLGRPQSCGVGFKSSVQWAEHSCCLERSSSSVPCLPV